jgi:hypothetical protein
MENRIMLHFAFTFVVFFSLGFSQAYANETCYDFSDFSGQVRPPYTQPFPDGTINVHNTRYLNGQIRNNPGHYASINYTEISGGVSPELGGYLVNTQFILNTPNTLVTVKFAQNSPGGLSFVSTLAVNGERIQLANGLPSADGLVLGPDTGGQVLVSVDLDRTPTPGVDNWYAGDITLEALTGSIERFTLGTTNFKIDDVCFTN